MWSSPSILWKIKKSFQIQNSVLYFLTLINLHAIGTNLNLLNYHQYAPSYLFYSLYCFYFLYLNKASAFKHLWFFPPFNSLNFIFCFCQLCSFTNFLIWVLFPFTLLFPSSCTSLPHFLVYYCMSFIHSSSFTYMPVCLYASPSFILLPELILLNLLP